MSIVCKFGGTSLANSENIKKVCEIVKSNPDRKYVVVSAPGKRSKEDTKITDYLINCFKKSKKGESFEEDFQMIQNRFNDLLEELEVSLDLSKDFETLKDVIAKHDDYDFVLSRGEFFSARIISKYLGFKFVDCADVIKFDADGRVDVDLTEELVNQAIGEENVVFPGFYGSDSEGKVRVFSRGGSDLSGAIVANSVKAETYENWTDVDGFLACDPRLCSNPPIINVLSYHELRELSYMGATVLHPSCTGFLKDKGIKINLRNTFNPECEGSLIVPDGDEKLALSKTITGIAGQKGFTILNIEKYDINESLGLIETIAKIYKKYKISIEHIPTGIDSVSVISKSDSMPPEVLEQICNEIIAEIIPDKIQVFDKVALISVVGNALKNNFSLERKVFESVFMCDSELLTVNKSANGISVVFGVYEENFKQIVKSLYVNLIK